MEEEDEEWMSKFGELREDLEHHIKEEEGELFPKAREILGAEAEEVGRRFEEAKEQYRATQDEVPENRAARRRGERDEESAGERTNGREGEDVGSLTRDELYERARKLGIDGRSKMTKNELARAVRARG